MSGTLKPLSGRWSPRSDLGRYHLARALLSLVTFAGVMLLFPGGESRSLLHMRVGQVSPRRIVAPFSFRVYKSDARLQSEREAAMAAVPAVVTRDAAKADASLAQLSAYSAQIRELDKRRVSPEMRAAELARLGPGISESTREVLQVPRLSVAVLDVARKSLAESYAHGIMSRSDLAQTRLAREAAVRAAALEHTEPVTGFTDPDGAAEAARAAGQQVWGEGSAAAEAVSDVVRAFAGPNAELDHRELELRRSIARESVPLFSGSVLQDEKIVDAHERVTEDILLKLRSLDAAEERQSADTGGAAWLWPRLGRALTTLLLLVVFVLYLKLYRPSIYRDTSLLVLLAAIMLFVMAVAALSVRVFYISEYLIPTAVLPILVTVLFEHQLALFAGLLQ